MTSRRDLLTVWFRGLGPRQPITVDRQRCWAALGQPCDYCVKECPHGAPALRLGDAGPVVGTACDGCGLCVAICTATPSALSMSYGAA